MFCSKSKCACAIIFRDTSVGGVGEGGGRHIVILMLIREHNIIVLMCCCCGIFNIFKFKRLKKNVDKVSTFATLLKSKMLNTKPY